MARKWAMASGATFTIKPINEFVRRYLPLGLFAAGKVIVDPFAGDNANKFGTITNDLNPGKPTDFHEDAIVFLKHQPDNSADFVLYDPPYSFRQASELYQGYGKELHSQSPTRLDYWAQCKNEIARIIKPGGIVLSFGWNSNGMGKNRGFEILEVLLVAHGGSRNDTVCVAEKFLKKLCKNT